MSPSSTLFAVVMLYIFVKTNAHPEPYNAAGDISCGQTVSGDLNADATPNNLAFQFNISSDPVTFLTCNVARDAYLGYLEWSTSSGGSWQDVGVYCNPDFNQYPEGCVTCTDGSDESWTIDFLPPGKHWLLFYWNGGYGSAYYEIHMKCGPTVSPTSEPTTLRALSTTNYQTSSSTHLVAPTSTLEVNAVETNTRENLESTFRSILLLVASFFALIILCSTIDAWFLRLNDFYKISVLITCFMEILDLLTDCFLSIDISIKTKYDKQFKILFYCSIIFIVVPSVFSLFQVYWYSRNVWSKYDVTKEWLVKYSKLLYVTSIATGSSFTAVQIMNCNLFRLECFDMGLSYQQTIDFKTQRIYSVVLLENIPQLILQILYLHELKDSNLIAICSSIFSGISIVVTIMSKILQRSIINSQQYTIITFHVTGNSIVSKIKYCKTRVKQIKQEISLMIGLDLKFIEIIKPISISNGLQLTIHLYVDNNQGKTQNFEQLFVNGNQNGQLAQIISDSWSLSQMANITDIRCRHCQSTNSSFDTQNVYKILELE